MSKNLDMDTPKSPSGSQRRHGRNVSRPMVVRRSTKGPLDAEVDDPLAEPAVSPSVASSSGVASPLVGGETQATTPLPEPAFAQQAKVNVDLSFLQDPNSYHPLPTDDVGSSFLESELRPPPRTPLPDLLSGGHFRRAADAAANDLLQCPSHEAEQILQLYYTRLACLVLVTRTDLAAQEASPLLDLLARNPPGAKDVVSILPWELRLLLVRLQSLGTTDGGRRGIMALYALASEVRTHVKQARMSSNEADKEIWSARLQDVGLRVADALVEMGELETANRHLDTLTDVDAEEVAYRKSLLRIRVGDVTAARRYMEKLSEGQRTSSLKALLKIADDDFRGAQDELQSLLDQEPQQALKSNNLAVAMLYTGHIKESGRVLEELIAQSPAFPGLLFNLSTVYELATERSLDRKSDLTQLLAAKTPAPDTGGWEKSNYEFKL